MKFKSIPLSNYLCVFLGPLCYQEVFFVIAIEMKSLPKSISSAIEMFSLNNWCIIRDRPFRCNILKLYQNLFSKVIMSGTFKAETKNILKLR